MRHGGASRDSLLQLRSSAAIQKRGRWAVPTSQRIYEKPGRLQQLLDKTPLRQMQYAKRVRESFAVFVRAGSAPEPPRV